MSVHLVSCVSRKAATASPARDLYRSPWFRKARAYVEARGDRWWILSAEHGLVGPDELIAPYEKTLNRMPIADRRRWAQGVYSRLVEELHPGEEVVFLAGARYREHLEARLVGDGFRVVVPMRRLGIGQQLSWLGKS